MANPIMVGMALSGVTPTATSSDASYPVTNLLTGFETDLWKSDSTSQTQMLKIDFGSARSVDSVVIGEGHNLHSLGLTSEQYVHIECSNDDSTYYEMKVWYGNEITAAALYGAWSVQSMRYWKLSFLKGSALSAKPQIGNIFYGLKFTPTFNYKYPFSIGDKVFETSVSKSLMGVIRTSQPYDGRKQFNFTFQLESDSVITNWRTFLSTVRGRFLPFYFIDIDSVIYLVHLNKDYNPAKTVTYNYNDIESIELIKQQVG